ncbi:metallophosphoesterase [Streptomyces justiciae]|uniref:Metallophosphoesterase n=1 Tax=Streptomyces justiciae TaxID=2780140 RepID=A0ABU3LNH2_9ACTN|nr:metallophosphoesterase [Streptomyces justiciae]MDT7840781.1 metallophosphoesterase [Streptomyces justiciae]
MVIVFAVLALAVLVTANWYLWRRLFRDTTSGPGWGRRAGVAVVAGGWLLAIGALVGERTGAPFWLQQTLAWPGFLWLALSIYLLLGVVAGEAVRPLLRRFLERRDRRRAPVAAVVVPQPEPVPAGAGPEEPAEPASPRLLAAPSRRLFVSRVVGGAAAAAAVGTVGYGTYGVLRGPRVKRVTVPLAKLPRAAHGFRIAVVSDIHLGPVLGRGFAQKVVDTVNSTQPDLIAVVGDLVDGSVKDLGPAAAPLSQLKAPAYFVTGNHEYFSGAEQWVEEVRRLGLLPLENARTELRHFDLAGVNDIAGESEGQGPDFGKALGDRDTTRVCVLLAHQPVQIHDAVEHGVDLQLSGHTHGGQLWPGNLIAEAANPTVAGLERYGDTQLYVSRGAGAWGPPTRVGAPSDITVIELASRQA